MPISVACSKCNRKYHVRDELAGKVAKCPCGQTVAIPKPTPEPTPIAWTSLLDDENIAVASPVDPFAGIAEDAGLQGSPLAPLRSRGKGKKHFGRKGGNPYLIPAVAGGAVVVVLLVAVVVVAVSGGGSPTAASPGVAAAPPAPTARWATPEAVFEAQKKALAERDWKTLYETCSPNGQRAIAGGMALMASTLCRVIPEFEAIRTEFGLGRIAPTPQMLQARNPADLEKQLLAEAEKMVDQVTDKFGLFAKVMNALTSEKTQDPTGMAIRQLREGLAAEANAQLSNLQVSGDTASGTSTFTVQGRPRQEPLEFVKIDGDWRIEEKMFAAGGPAL